MQYHTRLTIINMFTNITFANILLQTWTQPTDKLSVLSNFRLNLLTLKWKSLLTVSD